MEWTRRRGGLAGACSLLALLCAPLCAPARPSAGRSWLKTYGYLLPSDSRMSALQSGKAMQTAVATMQQFYGIPVTGVLDQTTIEWMKKPRCGVPDHPHLSHNRRKKRYALTGQKWRQKHITYRSSSCMRGSGTSCMQGYAIRVAASLGQGLCLHWFRQLWTQDRTQLLDWLVSVAVERLACGRCRTRTGVGPSGPGIPGQAHCPS